MKHAGTLHSTPHLLLVLPKCQSSSLTAHALPLGVVQIWPRWDGLPHWE